MRPVLSLLLRANRFAAVFMGALCLAVPAFSAENTEADKLWQETKALLKPPEPPDAWRINQPSEEEITAFIRAELPRLAVAADKARSFREQFPDHAASNEALLGEMMLLNIAVQMDNREVIPRLAALEELRLADPNLSEDERFELRFMPYQRELMKIDRENHDAMSAVFEKAARELNKEFPARQEPYQMLMLVAQQVEAEKALPLLREMVNSQAPDEVKEQASMLLASLERIGKPLDLQFTAVDGRKVDLSALKGRVVLINFWATWCPSCVAGMPETLSVYNKLKDQGFEIIGISLDQSKRALERMIEKRGMTWPQYFDGLGWNNVFVKKFNITSVPAMWLVDRQGNLADIKASENLEEKVRALLAEQPASQQPVQGLGRPPDAVP